MRAALRFLTRIPVGDRPGRKRRCGRRCGRRHRCRLVRSRRRRRSACSGPSRCSCLARSSPGPPTVLALAIAAIVSGALHLDGLADTADALAGSRCRTRGAGATGPADRSRRCGRRRAHPAARRRHVRHPRGSAGVGSARPLFAAPGRRRAACSRSTAVAARSPRRFDPARPRWTGSSRDVSVRAAAFSAASTAIPGVIALLALRVARTPRGRRSPAVIGGPGGGHRHLAPAPRPRRRWLRRRRRAGHTQSPCSHRRAASPMSRHVVVVLGGHSERQEPVRSCDARPSSRAGRPVTYLATALPGDPGARSADRGPPARAPARLADRRGRWRSRRRRSVRSPATRRSCSTA